MTKVVERALAFCQSHFPRVEDAAWQDTVAESRLLSPGTRVEALDDVSATLHGRDGSVHLRFGHLTLRHALIEVAKHPISFLLEVLTSQFGGYYRRNPVSTDRERTLSVDNVGDTSPCSSARHSNSSLTLAEARRGPFQPGAPADKFLLADSVLRHVGRTRDCANAGARETRPDSERVAPAPDAFATGLPLPDGRARGMQRSDCAAPTPEQPWGGLRTTERTSS